MIYKDHHICTNQIQSQPSDLCGQKEQINRRIRVESLGHFLSLIGRHRAIQSEPTDRSELAVSQPINDQIHGGLELAEDQSSMGTHHRIALLRPYAALGQKLCQTSHLAGKSQTAQRQLLAGKRHLNFAPFRVRLAQHQTGVVAEFPKIDEDLECVHSQRWLLLSRFALLRNRQVPSKIFVQFCLQRAQLAVSVLDSRK